MNPLPKIDLMLRFGDARGSPLLPFCLGSLHLSEYSLRIGIRKTFPIRECLQSRPKGPEKGQSFYREKRPQIPPDHAQAEQQKNSLNIPIPPLILRHRNYIQLVEKKQTFPPDWYVILPTKSSVSKY